MSQDDGRRLKALFEMATDGIITMNDRGIMENVNRAACELFGYSADELRGQKVNMLMSSHDRTHHDEYLERYQATRVPHIIGIGREVTGRCKDGREFPLRLAVSETTLEEGTIYTGILHDLSEFHLAKKRVEDLNRSLESKVIERTAALRAREAELQRALGKERELNELKSRFLALASHEFKTPLSTVLSSAELVELYPDADQQPKRQRHLDRIRDAVGQLTEILNDFLSLGQLEQGVIQPEAREVVLETVLSAAVEASGGQLKQGQNIEVDAPGGDTPVWIDAKLVRRVLINLLSNAAKYSPPGSPIYLRGEVLSDSLFIEVQDFGIGIPDADQQHLFDRFFRARNVENIKGTGLGLNIVAQYVELMGGEVALNSREGEGTLVRVRLPCGQN